MLRDLLNSMTEQDDSITVKLDRTKDGFKAVVAARVKGAEKLDENPDREPDGEARLLAVLSQPFVARGKTREEAVAEMEAYLKDGVPARQAAASALADYREASEDAVKAAKEEKDNKGRKATKKKAAKKKATTKKAASAPEQSKAEKADEKDGESKTRSLDNCDLFGGDKK